MALETNLKGRSAVITGASEGIGRATAWLLAAEGANIFLTARNAERRAALKAELEPATGITGTRLELVKS